ncbi:hypothetical protein [Streptomyces qinglanensis]|nr:hypothetical protein [Streptomyces qinglanensis]
MPDAPNPPAPDDHRRVPAVLAHLRRADPGAAAGTGAAVPAAPPSGGRIPSER